MGKVGLSGRAVWQDYSGLNAGVAEKQFFDVFAHEFRGSAFRIRAKPQEFKDIYVNVELHPDTLGQIYSPPEAITKHGITPDYAIDNLDSNRTLYVEVKRQDGWVEGKPRSAGRGNAHERSNKFFTPGLLSTLRAKGGLGDNVLPFWTVFQGDITRDPCRVREIALWYGEHNAHFFMWRDASNAVPLVTHFNTHLRQLLIK
jgi:hypothetical protein